MAKKAKSKKAAAKKPARKARASAARAKRPARKSAPKWATKGKVAKRKAPKAAAKKKAPKAAPRRAAKAKPAAAKKHSAPPPKRQMNEGEGNKSADKTYREAATRFTDTHDTAALAEQAARRSRCQSARVRRCGERRSFTQRGRSPAG